MAKASEVKNIKIIDANGRVYLRSVTISDVNQSYYGWMHDEQVTQYLESRFSPNTMEDIKEFVNNANNDPATELFAICRKQDDRHIGNIKLGRINLMHKNAEASIMIGDKSCWGKGYGSEAIKLLVEYGFNSLKLNKIIAECYANNKGSFNAFKKAGFKEEGLKRKHYICNNQYVDANILGIVNEDK